MITKTQFTTEWFLAKSGTVLTHSKIGLTQPQLDVVQHKEKKVALK